MLNWFEVFIISKIKNTVPWTYIINDLNGEQIIGTFYWNKNCKRLIKKNSELEKYLKEKVISYMSNGKAIIIHLIAGLIK